MLLNGERMVVTYTKQSLLVGSVIGNR